jgi:putative inorganic carbon (HCO3(-)) transporter
VSETAARPRLRRAALVAAIAVLAVLVVAAGAVLRGPTGAAALVGAIVVAYLLAALDIAVIFSLAVACSIFSGYSSLLHLPIGPDRMLFALGVVLLCWQYLLDAREPGGRRLPVSRFTATHWLALLAACYAIVSALAVQTLTQRSSFFGLLDRFGLVPFAMFFLAPLIFRTHRQRMILVTTLVCVGAYLAFTAAAEFTHLNALVFPRYILNPDLGIHYGRSRGPFLEAVANGLALQECGVAAALAVVLWRRRLARVIAAGVALACAAGILFTLTRAVWIGAAASTILVMATAPQLRRLLIPAVVLGVLSIGIAFAAVPSLKDRADARAQSQGPVWDRYNTDAAALRMIQEKPAFGWGWDSFVTEGTAHLRQARTYPLTGAGLNVHNVFLSHATELGLVGFALWFGAFAGAIGGALFGPVESALRPFRIALVAIASCWVIVANFGPLGYAFPTLLLWTLAGIIRGPSMLIAPRPALRAAPAEAEPPRAAVAA